MIRRYVVGFLFPVDQPGHVILLRKDTKRKEGVEFMDGMLNGLGGKVEEREAAQDAMNRECHEEANLIADWEHVAILTDGTFQLDIYRAECESHHVPDSNDVGEMFLCVPIRAVVEQAVVTVPNLQWMVPMCLEADRAFWPFSIIQGVPGD